MKLTGAQILIKSLELEGVDCVFGLPGGAILPTFDAMYDSKKIKFGIWLSGPDSTELSGPYTLGPRSNSSVSIFIPTQKRGKFSIKNITVLSIFPLAVFLVLGIFNQKIKPAVSGYIGVLGLLASSILSFYAAYQYYFVYGKVNGVFQTFVEKTTWMNFTDTLKIDMGILVDPISVMMLLVVSIISFMVHIYSRGYMKGDDGYTRFFSFLGLFSFSIYGLVLATNLFQIYIFWELVGVSSYLLIGYYYTKTSAVAAGKKAFIVTRFADLGFLIGILIIGYYT